MHVAQPFKASQALQRSLLCYKIIGFSEQLHLSITMPECAKYKLEKYKLYVASQLLNSIVAKEY